MKSDLIGITALAVLLLAMMALVNWLNSPEQVFIRQCSGMGMQIVSQSPLECGRP